MIKIGDLIRLIFTTGVIAFLLFLLARDAFPRLLWFLALYIVIDVSLTIFIRKERHRRSSEAVQKFLREDNETKDDAMLLAISAETAPVFEHMSQALKEAEAEIQALKKEKMEEHLILERWVHEVKTPLALFLILLENEKNQLDPETYHELHRLRHQLDMQIMQILYYGKMDAKHPDERFEMMSLQNVVEKALEELHYEALLRDLHFDLVVESSDFEVLTDPRIFQLILTQILNNALKYSPRTGVIQIKIDDIKRRLSVHDGGAGVRPEDLPFLFDRAFSGVHPNRSKSTGLGLYLADFYAIKLGIQLLVDPVSTEGKGFLIHLDFPQPDSIRIRS